MIDLKQIRFWFLIFILVFTILETTVFLNRSPTIAKFKFQFKVWLVTNVLVIMAIFAYIMVNIP